MLGAMRFLSAAGRKISFPRGGILAQTAEAKAARINATIGMALRDDRSPLGLPSLESSLGVSPSEALPYAPSHGLPALRVRWGELLREKNPSLRVPASVPVVVSGLTQGLDIACELFLDPGDALILAEPYWENYALRFRDVGGCAPRTFPLFAGDAFNVEGLRNCLREAPGKAALLLNFPNNPTGYTPTFAEVDAIIRLLREKAEEGHVITVIIDDAYFGLVYAEGVFRESLFAPLASLHENILAVKVDGCSKEDYAWGLRVAFLTYAGKGLTADDLRLLEDKSAAVVRARISNAAHLSQSVVLHALQSPTYGEEKARHAHLLERRYRAALAAALEPSYARFFRPLPCNSGYFLCLALAGGLDGEAVRRRLLAECGIGVIALGERLLRVAFSSVPEAQIPELFSAIAACCSPSSFPSSS